MEPQLGVISRRRLEEQIPGGGVAPPAQSQGNGAVFGLYPQVTGGSQRATYGTDQKLSAGVLATGPSSFQPALPPVPVAAPAIVGGGNGQRAGMQDPRIVAGEVSPVQSAVQASSQNATAAPAPITPPGNVITRIGNSYQGQNITGDIQLQNGQGMPIDGRGGGTVSSLDTSAGYAQDLKDLAAIQAGKDQVAADNKAQYDALQIQTLTRQYVGGNKNAGAILNRNQQNATAKRGQDQQAAQQGAITKLAQQKQASDATTAGLDQQTKAALLRAQNAVINAKTPAEKVAAEDVLRTLTGKFEKTPVDAFAYAPGGQVIDPASGQLVTQPGVIFNKATGAVSAPQAAKAAQNFETGKPYTDVKGNKAKWDGQNFVAIK